MFLIHHSLYEIRNTPDKGRGVYALRQIPPGTIIGDYIGTILPREKAAKNESEGHFHMHLIEDLYCLADKDEEGVHLLNHSCAPSCAVEDYQGHALFYALRTIHQGEELTVSYGLGRPDARCNPCQHACHCGSKFCKGSWHSAEDEFDIKASMDSAEYKKLAESMMRAVGTELQPLAQYPSAYPDNDWFELFANEYAEPEINNDSTLHSIQMLRSKIRNSGAPQKYPAIGITVFAIHNNLLSAERI